MNELNTFHHSILNQFEFSITGYDNIDEQLNKFFDTICDSPVFIGRKHIDCISYAYAKLKNIEPFEIESLTNTQFYFNSFNERSFELYIISDYYFLKNELRRLLYRKNGTVYWKKRTKNDGIDNSNRNVSISIKTSEVASKLFTNPASYRIAITERNHTVIKYEQHLDVISFEIPFLSIFKGATKDSNIEDIKNQFFKTYGNDLIKNKGKEDFSVKKNRNKYSLEKSEGMIKIFKNINYDGIKDIFEILKAKILLFNKTNDSYFFGSNPEMDVIDAFIKLIITHAFLSAFFDCWIENIPSVIQVNEIEKTKKCLGNIVVGYSIKQEIDATERIYFRMLSDRISSNLAANTVFELSPELRFKRLRRIQIDFLNKFNREVLTSDPSIDHGANSLTQEHVDKKNEFFGKISNDTIEKYSLKSFKKFVDEQFLVDSTIDKGIFTCFHKNTNPACSIYKNSDNSYSFENKIKFEHNNEPTFNMVIIQNLIDEIKKECSDYNVTIITSDNAMEIKFSCCNEIDLSKFLKSISRNKDGNFNKSGSLGQFMCNNYEAFRILGNLIIGIEELGAFIPLIDFEKHLSPKYTNGKVERLEHQLTLINKINEVIYKVIFKSI